MKVPNPEKASRGKESVGNLVTILLMAAANDTVKHGMDYVFSHWHEISGFIENTAHLLV